MNEIAAGTPWYAYQAAYLVRDNREVLELVIGNKGIPQDEDAIPEWLPWAREMQAVTPGTTIRWWRGNTVRDEGFVVEFA